MNDTLIPSKVTDATSSTEYTYHASGIKGRVFALGDVDLFGQETIHGPFRLGRTYGQKTSSKTIDWKKIKGEHKTKKAQRKHNKLKRTRRHMGLMKIHVN